MTDIYIHRPACTFETRLLQLTHWLNLFTSSSIIYIHVWNVRYSLDVPGTYVTYLQSLYIIELEEELSSALVIAEASKLVKEVDTSELPNEDEVDSSSHNHTQVSYSTADIQACISVWYFSSIYGWLSDFYAP